MKTTLHAQGCLRPFPQHIKYTKGVIKPSDVSQKEMDDSVRSFYNAWKERYINDDAGDGQYYIWVEGTVSTYLCVSEGQGYGMMIVALMAGYDADAQKTFDGLYRYFKLHPSGRSPYLMAWAQTPTFADADRSSASDGDMDIAYSLLLANAQWGSTGAVNYKEEADLMIDAIMKQEINNETYSVLLSNDVLFDSKDYFDTRSSDFMPAHFKEFKKASKNNNWDKVIEHTYKLFNFLKNNYSEEAGLIPDFILNLNTTPVPAGPNYLESKNDGNYNYNACRVPWRIATDYILNGDNRAKTFIDELNKWIRIKCNDDPAKIAAGYTLSGGVIRGRKFSDMCFVAPFTVAAMADEKNQLWLNNLYKLIINLNIDECDYYGNSLKMLMLFIISGNYWHP